MSRTYRPTEWTPTLTGYYSIIVDDEAYDYQGARETWSMTAVNDRTVRFELRDGDQHWWDASTDHPTERVELAGRVAMPVEEAIHISYGFMLEDGAPNTADWVVLGQLHQNLEDTVAGPPPFDISLDGEFMTVGINYSDAKGKNTGSYLYKDAIAIDRGHTYDIDIKVQFDHTGENGRLVVTRDGVTIVDYKGPIGYSHMSGVYWAQGIYRDDAATDTMAAVYSDLEIETGDVRFPGSGDYIGAPRLDVSLLKADGDRFAFELTGKAKLDTRVSILADGKTVAAGDVRQDGTVSLELDRLSVGVHEFHAVATDRETGRQGIVSAPMTVAIGTAAEISKQFEALAKNPGLGGILITDGAPITVTSLAELGRFVRYADAVAKIEGGVEFLYSEAVTGRAYDRQVTTYDSLGAAIHVQRLSGAKIVFDQSIDGDHAVTRTLAADGTQDVITTVAGKITVVVKYAASGTLLFEQVKNDDGSSRISYYDATGTALARTTEYHADGSRLQMEYGIKGRDYVAQSFAYNKAGVLTEQSRLDASGRELISFDPVRGSSTTYTYDGAGAQATGYTLRLADKSYSVVTFFEGTDDVRTISYYSAAGKLIDLVTNAESFVGTRGNDSFEVHASGAKVAEDKNGGFDTVIAHANYTLGNNIEALVLAGDAAKGTGNDLGNRLTGNGKANSLEGVAGNDTIEGGRGDDTMSGGAGNDLYVVDSAGDVIVESRPNGRDTVTSTVTFTLGATLEVLTLTGSADIDATGNALANPIQGNNGDNALFGLGGYDLLSGNAGDDSLQGSDGRDTLNGGVGRDVLNGGTGADLFMFDDREFGGKTERTADLIEDFSQVQRDRIDLGRVDADLDRSGDQSFKFMGDKAFTGLGQIRFEHVDGATILYGNTDGNLAPEFAIKFAGEIDLLKGDFIF